MDNRKNIEEFEMYQEQIKNLYRELVTDGVYDKWADTFELESIQEDLVIFSYSGSFSIRTFMKECKSVLAYCICYILGEGKKIKIIKKKSGNISKNVDKYVDKNIGKNTGIELSPRAKKNITAVKFFVIGMLFVCVATAIIIVMCNYIGNRNFKETFYNASSIKINSNLRIIQLSDMHGVTYGKNNEKLIGRIKALEPDIIICTGDIVDSAKEDVDYAVNLAQKLSKIAPSYYIYGNNEVESIYGFPLDEQKLDEKFGFTKYNRDETELLKIKDSFEKALEKNGIKVLKNEKDTIKIKNMTIDVYGVLTSNPSSFWSYSGKAFSDYIYNNPENIKITAIHEPVIFEEFQPDFWGDLMVCGHTHGGVMRVPVLGPLFTKEGGLFPGRSGGLVYGRYDAAGCPLIVSGGLENSNILRINNEPELVIIDVNKF